MGVFQIPQMALTQCQTIHHRQRSPKFHYVSFKTNFFLSIFNRLRFIQFNEHAFNGRVLNSTNSFNIVSDI